MLTSQLVIILRRSARIAKLSRIEPLQPNYPQTSTGHKQVLTTHVIKTNLRVSFSEPKIFLLKHNKWSSSCHAP